MYGLGIHPFNRPVNEMAPNSTIEITFAVLAIPLLIFLTICGIYLIYRAKHAKLPHVTYLGVSFLCLASFYITIVLRGLHIDVLFAISTGIGQLGLITLYLFVINAFYARRPNIRKWMLVFVVVLAVITATTAIIRDVPVQDPGYAVMTRMLHTVFATLQLSTASAFQAGASLKDYRKYRNAAVDRFVLFRYLVYGIAGLIVMISAWLDLIGTVFSILGMAEYEVIQILLISFVFTYSLLNLIVWVMPRWMKDLINKRNIGDEMPRGETQVDEEEIMRILERASDDKEK